MPVNDPDRIPVQRARWLRERGYSWREVGVALAAEVGRALPYHASSVQIAVTRSRGKSGAR